MTELPCGLLLLDKPAGVTSFDCVQLARRRFGTSKVGHCGTLDPAARGLLLLLVGAATREQDSFLNLSKQYWLKAQFGLRTSTGDREGEVVEEKPVDQVTIESLENVVSDFIGEIQQTPPLYSALKYKGKPYYRYARKGVEIPRFPRAVSIVSFSVLSFRLPYWEGRLVCSRGTYVRTLVEDVAKRLGSCATLVDLVRERIGSYALNQALKWEALRTGSELDLRSVLHPVKLEHATLHA